MNCSMGPTTSRPIVETDGDYLLYDGECPFCSAYVRLMRLREAGLNLRLLSAREHDVLVRQHRAQGRDVDQGMILRIGGATYFGGDVMHVLTLMSGQNSRFNRLFGWMFAKRWTARAIYPALRAGRNATLAVMGRSRVH